MRLLFSGFFILKKKLEQKRGRLSANFGMTDQLTDFDEYLKIE
jgi:hypothetical protein